MNSENSLYYKLFLESTKDQMGVLLTREQAAEYLGVSKSTLATWAAQKRYALKYVKVGRLVKYRISDLDDFIHRRTVMQNEL